MALCLRGSPLCMGVLLCAALLLSAHRASASQPTINEWCPVMTDEKADPNITTEYNGKTVALCCDTCLAKFKGNPDRYLARLPQFADSGTDEKPTDHDHSASGEHAHGLGGDGTEAEALAEQGQHEHEDVSEDRDDGRGPWLGRVHPVLVHFPLAGFPLALLGFLAWVTTGREAFAKADVVPLMAATLAAIAAVVTGNIAHDAMRFSDSLHRIVEQHQLIATIVMVLAICLSAMRVWRWDRLAGVWRGLYGVGLLVGCVLLAIVGFLGGSLVYGPGHLSF